MNPPSITTDLKILWHQGYFKKERGLNDVRTKLASTGSHPKSSALSNALSRATFLTERGKAGKHRFIQKHSPSEASLSADVLPDDLIKALKKDFTTEISDLKHNYGTSGICTAFLLRKILEKLIYLAFAKNDQVNKLLKPDKSLVGLQAMINLATSCKAAGKPFLTHKTADEIQGIKFLGDTAAHNPLAKVSMQTIQPNMPYIITAFEELATKL
jgi:hypothetical protein